MKQAVRRLVKIIAFATVTGFLMAAAVWILLSPDTLLDVINALLCKVAHAYGGRACS